MPTYQNKWACHEGNILFTFTSLPILKHKRVESIGWKTVIDTTLILNTLENMFMGNNLYIRYA